MLIQCHKSVKIIQKVIKLAVDDKDNYTGFKILVDILNQMHNNIGVFPNPQLLYVTCIWTREPKNTERPQLIKVTLSSPETDKFVESIEKNQQSEYRQKIHRSELEKRGMLIKNNYHGAHKGNTQDVFTLVRLLVA